MTINLEDVKELLSAKDIALDDEKLTKLINYYTNKIVSLTGIDLDVQTYHYTVENKRLVKKIVLPLSNIFDVDEIHIDFELLDDDKYFVDNKNGVIFFKEHIAYAEHIHIKYLTKTDDKLISTVIVPLLADMIADDMNTTQLGVNGEITSIHEGNTSISFKNSTSLKDSIQDRLNRLAKGELDGRATKKGAFFL